jgi:hypothetical protein
MVRYRTVRRVACSAILFLGGISCAHAEFLRTHSSGVYQHTTGSTKVLVGAKDSVQGIFILSGAPIAPQEFSSESELSSNTDNLFISFDPTAQPPRYSEVVIRDKRYQIRGNLKIRLGSHATVSIDNNNPYLTIVESGRIPEEPDDILGFAGTNEVVRGSGGVAAVLAANQLDDVGSASIPVFQVVKGELFLNGSPFTDAAVGVPVPLSHECLNGSSVVLTEEEVMNMSSDSKMDIETRSDKDKGQFGIFGQCSEGIERDFSMEKTNQGDTTNNTKNNTNKIRKKKNTKNNINEKEDKKENKKHNNKKKHNKTIKKK